MREDTQSASRSAQAQAWGYLAGATVFEIAFGLVVAGAIGLKLFGSAPTAAGTD